MTSRDGGHLYHGSYSLLLSHEDKTYPGAFIASLSIPWGEARSDQDQGGYHVVWTRDLVNTATGLLAAGNKITPLRALIYLAANQLPYGRFPQNFWIDGTPYWGGIQLDEVAFPILLAWRLQEENALLGFDPYTLVTRAAATSSVTARLPSRSDGKTRADIRLLRWPHASRRSFALRVFAASGAIPHRRGSWRSTRIFWKATSKHGW
jgi:hypothetical protein